METLRSAFKYGVPRQLRTKEAFKDSLLAEKYSWWTWMNDPDVGKEEKQYLKALATRAPFLDGLPDAQEFADDCELFFDHHKAEGLKVAYLVDGLSVSLLSSSLWKSPSLPATLRELQENGSILERKVNIRHASLACHVENEHSHWIVSNLKESVANGAELLERFPTCFPSLALCDAVHEHMRNLPVHIVPTFFRGLRCLEEYCQSWKSGGFNLADLGCRSTSEGQTAKVKYGIERTYLCPDGIKRTFTYHVKLGNPWRIYYDPAPGPGKMYIGFVGRHPRNKHDK
ncbi:MAG: hypothetical protein HQL65_07725 [Magnetococcales bacterium]|nr:hypothetical protein [Magnetococcales bacterium]